MRLVAQFGNFQEVGGDRRARAKLIPSLPDAPSKELWRGDFA
jgi:hypothetical protein